MMSQLSQMIIESPNAYLFCMKPSQADVMEELFNLERDQILQLIQANELCQLENGYSIFNVFEKETGKYLGYCGCNEIELKGNKEIELLWDLYKKSPDDEIDIEVTLAVRNFMFKQFKLTTLMSLILTSDDHKVEVAKALDMEKCSTIKDEDLEWDIFIVNRNSPKFLASYNNTESKPNLGIQP